MKFKLQILIVLLFLSGGYVNKALAQVPSPKEFFGFNIGDDYQLATFTQTEAYFKKLAETSKLVKIQVIGKTEMGKDQYMLIVTSEANQAKLARYKEISQKMARAEGISEEEAKAMAAEGKAIVWIDGGLHASEVVGIHQLIETLYQVLTLNDEETKRILDNVVILFTHANPDGQELVSNWYMREPVPEKRNLVGLPVLYEKYIGHDNNRDMYMLNMSESKNIARQLFVEWIPQIMYNHHQRGPAGSVLAGPPYRNPFNYTFDPGMITGIDAVGAAMYSRLNAENKPGFTRLDGSSFSTWYNGGLRTTSHFHNIIGILTEIIGGPTPESIEVVPDRMIPNNNTPFPVMPQKVWHFRQSIDYSVSLNYAVLDYAARNGDHLLYNIYEMGKSSITKGNEDYWTAFPKKANAITEAYEADQEKKRGARGENGAMGGRTVPGYRNTAIPMSYYDSVFKAPEKRDARAYIIPSDQTDFSTATKFVNTLIGNGIQIEKATASFTAGGKSYPLGSYIVKTAQAFRPHILDMFEPQDYPNDFEYPGGPPIRPYDVAGWTLAYQMGVKFDRILDGLNDGPFEKVPYGDLLPPPAAPLPSSGGFLLNGSVNDSYMAVNDLLKAGLEVYRTKVGVQGFPVGSFYMPSSKGLDILKKANASYTAIALPAKGKPTNISKISPSRIALFDNYGGSISSGWVRWILEQYHYGYSLIFPKEIDAGNLNQKYDVILFIDNGVPAFGRNPFGRGFGGRGAMNFGTIPETYQHMVGSLTAEKSVPQLRTFIENGGKIVAVGDNTQLAFHLGLPVTNALVEMVKGKEMALTGEKYFVPGSILRVKVDSTQSVAWGMPAYADVDFENNPVFKFKPEAEKSGVVALTWFDTDLPLRSGWAWGQSYLKDGITSFVAPLGKGKFYAFSPEITNRAQAHSTFKLLFNTLFQGVE